MLNSFIEFLKNITASQNKHDTLEHYIIAHNPVDIYDIDRLEREYYDRLQARNRNFHYY